jgi:hypothetical protein
MANRTLRRAKPGDNPPTPTAIRTVPIPDIGVDDSIRSESESIEDVAGDSGADDNNAHGEPNRTERIGVVEIDPAQLGEYVNRTVAGDSDGNSNSNRTRRQRSDSGVKRGRKAKVQATQDIAPIATMVSTWASVLLKTPELMLDKDEVKTLSESYAAFSEYHTVPLMTPKRMSEVNLIATVLILAGPRLVAIRNRKKEEQKRGNVTPIDNRANVRH